MVEKFEIAGLTVEMNARGEPLYSRTRRYLCPQERRADIRIDLSDAFFESRQRASPTLTLGECRYLWTGEAFYGRLLDFGGFMLHASCVEYRGQAYLFSANSGTGKSTHTHLWLRELPGSRIINDDKPALRRTDGSYLAYGTPFSGKTDENLPTSAPVRAVVFLERAGQNAVEPLTVREALPLFMPQMIRPRTVKYMDVTLGLLDGLLRSVPVLRLKCNMSPEAAHVSYEGVEAYCERRERS